VNPHARNAGVAAGTLLASSATLVCCVLPALMVSLGAGATLASLVSTVPQLVWLSREKGWVFGIAALLLAASGYLLWRGRAAPCPADPRAARACATLRRVGSTLYGIALVAFVTGATFAFVLPRLRG
jgi:hypothetical protein